jgi:hypothetical protein
MYLENKELWTVGGRRRGEMLFWIATTCLFLKSIISRWDAKNGERIVRTYMTEYLRVEREYQTSIMICNAKDHLFRKDNFNGNRFTIVWK